MRTALAWRQGAILALPLLASACAAAVPGSSTFSCDAAAPDGVCASAREVYRQTDGRAATWRAPGTTTTSPPSSPGIARADPASTEAPPAGAAAPNAVLPVAFGQDGAVPLRAPPTILRVWIAPWETQQGDLHMAGYVYTELVPRRWMVGNAPVPTQAVLRPLAPDAPLPRSAPTGGDPRGAPPPPVAPLEPRRELQARGDGLDDDGGGGFFGPRPPVVPASAYRPPQAAARQ